MVSRVFIRRREGSNYSAPTRVLHIYKKVGDFVNVGDLLFITVDEENVSDYISSVRGIVKKVYYVAGDNINFNQPVLEILQTNEAVESNNNNYPRNNRKEVDFVSWETVESNNNNFSNEKKFGVNNKFQSKFQQESAPITSATPVVPSTPVRNFPQNIVSGEKKITSYARMLAEKIGLPIRDLIGTGPGGWITRSDVLRAASQIGLISEEFDDVGLLSVSRVQQTEQPIETNNVHWTNNPAPQVSEKSCSKNKTCHKCCEKQNAGSSFSEQHHSASTPAEKASHPEFDVNAFNSRFQSVQSNNESINDIESEIFSNDNTKEDNFNDIDATPVANTKSIVETSYSGYEANVAPSWHVSFKVDVTRVIQACKRLNSDSGQSRPRVTVLCYIIKALAETLHSFPVFNSMIGNDGELIFNEDVNVGLLFGLNNADSAVVSTFKGNSQLDVIKIAREIHEIISDKLSAKVRRIESYGNKKPSVMLYDLSDFGSVGKLPGLTDGHVVTFSVGDVFEVEIGEEVAKRSSDLYFITFSIVADRRFSDSTSVYDFIRIFKKNMVDEANKLL